MANNQQLLMGEGAGGAPVVYVEDVFSTYLYTGTGAALTITNNIDLSTKGGLVWIKQRNAATYTHNLVDTARGVDKYLYSPATNAQDTVTTRLQSFNSTGFSLGSNLSVNGSGNTMASWTFREQPKFFDIVTYTGNGTAGRTVAHSLGSVPGFIMVKRTDTSSDWNAYHTSLGATKLLIPNGTDAAVTVSFPWNNTEPTAAVFTVGSGTTVNASGGTYVAYLFAHNAGGFGLAGTDNVISCGTFTADGSGNATVTLGYEPQYVMWKRSDGTGDWTVLDTMRGWAQTVAQRLVPNTSAAEDSMSGGVGYTPFPTATGFVTGQQVAANGTYIYIAIRRGPMKVPTVGTSVFSPVLRTATTAIAQVTSVGFAPDVHLCSTTDVAGNYHPIVSRLRGAANQLYTNRSDAESAQANTVTSFNMNGISLGSDSSNYYVNNAGAGAQRIDHFFKRAPGFFDEVCYTGTGTSGRTIDHNLGVAPEMMILKSRSDSGTNYQWFVYHKDIPPTPYATNLALNSTDAAYAWSEIIKTPTATTFGINDSFGNAPGSTFVAYLFATCAGVSKVGSYTGNGSSQTIACGFTAGSRFVMIKRTDSTGAWYVWDSARGIVAGNDPHLRLNSTAAEVTTDDSVDTDNSGFIVNQDAATNVNVTSATYIFLAIA
jgi:hypothetical protein